MRFNTHDRTPRVKTLPLLKVLFGICALGIYSTFGLAAFACFYYAQNILAGLSVIFLCLAVTMFCLIPISDMRKAYVEFDKESVRVVDYYLGMRKEKQIPLCDITSAEVYLGYSHKVKGYRISAGMRYIVFKSNNQYLFKNLYLPETEQLLKQYIQES